MKKLLLYQKLWVLICCLLIGNHAMQGSDMKPAKKNSLKEYKKKRDFKKTPEPQAKKRAKKTKEPLYVIQHHEASHDHYDLRLEINGVLKSWAIPKGPSLDPAVKRLAVETEDHPMAYADFEGIIPQGQYGGGTVMVWDIGTYDNSKAEYGTTMADAYKKGRIEVEIHGKKLQGAFALIKTKLGWLFFKQEDEFASARKNPVKSQKKSALTGRTMLQIKKQESE